MKGAFLKGDFKNNEEIDMTIPKGFEKYNPDKNTWLQITRPIYRLKHAGLYYYQKAKRSMHANGFEQSDADPCLLFAWRPEGIVIWLTWVDENLVIVPISIVDKEKI